MIESILRNTILFIVLVFLQVVLFDNIDYFGFISPYIYVIFILSLPVGINKNWAMILSFILGMLIDMFSNTMGIHTFACVFVAFFRNNWINALFSHNDFALTSPSIKSFGFANYLKYAIGIVFVHHALLFYLETLSVRFFWITLLSVICNTIVTLLLILCYDLARKK
ncbi:MAG: rod shape-determining protein MreD [Bacteroidia bacterium]|nr:rod shape-determining protein MreD [Bacteroidia bacterium]